MKKVLFTALLLAMCASVFAGVDKSTVISFDEYVNKYGDDSNFNAQKDMLRTEYETVVRDVIPFFDAMNTDASVKLYFDYEWAIGGKVYQTDIVYINDEYKLDFYDMHLEQDGLHGRVEMVNRPQNRTASLGLYFDDFLLKSDETIVPGPCNCGDYGAPGMYTTFSLEGVRFESSADGYTVSADTLETVEVWSYPEGGWRYINGGSVTLDWKGNVLSYSPCNAKQSFEINNVICRLTRVEWQGQELFMEGDLLYPDFNLAITPKNLRMNILDEMLQYDVSDDPYSFELFGFKCTGSGFSSFVEDSWWDYTQYLSLSNVELHYKDETYPLGLVEVGSNEEGIVFKKRTSFSGPIKVYGYGPYDYMDNLCFTSEGLEGVLHGGYPEPFSGGIEYHRVTVNADGKVNFDDEDDQLGWSSSSVRFGNFSFPSRYPSQDEEGFYFGEARISTPDNCVVTNLALDGGLSISYDGTAEISSFGYPFAGPGKFCGQTFSPNEMQFLSDGLRFTGTYYLPDSLPGILSGRTLSLDLKLNLDGSVGQLVSELRGTYQISIPDTDIEIVFDDGYFEVDQRNLKGNLQPYTAYLVLKKPVFAGIGTETVSSKLRNIAQSGTVAFAMDGSLWYKMTGDADWQALNLKGDNLTGSKY